jgi:hypothetical protein
MALAAKAAGPRHVGQRNLACCKKPLGTLDTSPQHISMRARASRAFEGTGEVIGAETGHGSQGLNRQVLFQVGFDILLHPPQNDWRHPPRG